MLSFYQFITEAAKRYDYMWMVHPTTKELMLRKRTNKIGTHAEWMEHAGIVKPEHVSDLFDRKKQNKYDKVSRGEVEVDHVGKKIYHGQHTSHWKPETENVKKLVFKKHPETKKYNWIELGKGK